MATNIALRRPLNVQGVLKALTEGGFAAADCERLSLWLGLESRVVKNIKSDRSGQVENMLMDIIDHWILNSEASWEKLADAVKNCGYRNLATTLCRNSQDVKEESVSKQRRSSYGGVLPVKENEGDCNAVNISEPLDTEDRIYEFESQFGEMVDCVKDIINSNPSMRIQFCKDIKHGLPQPLKGLKDHIDYSTVKNDDVSEFFWKFHHICSFLDYDLLSFIIKRCGTVKLKSQMEKYRRSVEDFCVTTTIDELIRHWKPRFADHMIPDELISCVIKLDLDPAATKVIDLKIIQHQIERVLPHELAMAAFLVVHKVKTSSVTIVWLLWAKFVPHIMKLLKEFFETNPEFVREHRIVYCKVSEQILHASKFEHQKPTFTNLMTYTLNLLADEVNYSKHPLSFSRLFGIADNPWSRAHDDAYKHVENWLCQKKEFNIILVGKTGAGKSALVNSFLDISTEEGKVEICRDLFSATKEVKDHVKPLKFFLHDTNVQIWEIPTSMNPDEETARQYLDSIRRSWLTNDIALLIYCVNMTQVRSDIGDKNAIRMLTEEFGENIWNRSIFALTRANQFKLPVSADKGDSLESIFQGSLQGWGRILRKFLTDANVSSETAHAVPLIPCGYHKQPLIIMQEPNWSSSFRKVCLSRVQIDTIPAFLTVCSDSNDGSLNENSTQILVQRLETPRQEEASSVKVLLGHYDPKEITHYISDIMSAKIFRRNVKTAAIILLHAFAGTLALVAVK